MKEVYNYNTIFAEKKQGVFYNTEYGRWEYYGSNPVIRAGEPQRAQGKGKRRNERSV